MNILTSRHFILCKSDPTQQLEGQIQKAVRKIKEHVSPQDYKQLYPTGSVPGKFYGTEIHKQY